MYLKQVQPNYTSSVLQTHNLRNCDIIKKTNLKPPQNLRFSFVVLLGICAACVICDAHNILILLPNHIENVASIFLNRYIDNVSIFDIISIFFSYFFYVTFVSISTVKRQQQFKWPNIVDDIFGFLINSIIGAMAAMERC